MITTQATPSTLTPEQAAEQARILREGSARDAYQFARDIPGADIPGLQARLLSVCSGQEALLIAYFAKEVDGADVSSLQARILEIGVTTHPPATCREGAGLRSAKARLRWCALEG